MVKQKRQFTLPVFFAAIVISAIYWLAAHSVLQSYRVNIAFTRQELLGVEEYEQFIALYFELYSMRQPDKLLQKLQQAGSANRSWQF
jgi:hypothetical protein